ncbi:DUF6056 family protein [Salmonirosea aquatica]|uniref:Glycosyltransferase RgtA/B/C/D-like domain-containing protein n=1 Tax=Salmonirosea aquatica TaxID=2654236 RepID=A0A7C9BDR6_9BACT|nr:hypothetical protein [Cytophagaceae bacterium SJW1-29]
MNNLIRIYRTVGNTINIALLAGVLLPLIALSFYNHPSPADDYGYIDTVFKYGWLEAMHYYYTGWTGRYFGIFLNHTNPLLFHSVEGFKVLPVLVILGLVAILYGLARQLTPTLSWRAHLGFAGVLFFLYILKLPSVAEAFYWMAAFVTFSVPAIMTFGWIILTIRWYRLETKRLQILTTVFAGFLVFAIIGSSEPSLLTILILIAGLWGYRLLFHKKVDGFMIGMLVAAAIGCFFYFRAPGLTVRIGGNPLSGNIPKSMLNAFKTLTLLTVDWLTTTPILLFTVVWFIVLSRIVPQARAYFAVPFWYVSLLFLGVLAAQLFTPYYGIGIDPTAREVNYVYLFFLVGWFYVAGVLFHEVNSQFTLPHIPRLPQGIILTILAFWIVFDVYENANIRMVYKDWLSGKAATYNAKMYQRYELIKNSPTPVVYLPEIKDPPQSLFVDDIKEDKNHWWNKLMAGYFGKEAIYLKKADHD